MQICDTSVTEIRLMELYGFVINTKLVEGHHSSQNSEGEGSHLRLPFLQDKDSWVMGDLLES